MVVVGGLAGLSTLTGGAVASSAPESGMQTPINDRRLLVYEASSCSPCNRFREGLGASYVKTKYQDRVPLTYLPSNRQGDGRYALQRPVSIAPTFVVVDQQGREISRLVGFPRSSENFFDFIDQAL
jgi:hypothetical protein